MPQGLVRQVCLPPYLHVSSVFHILSTIHNSYFRYFSASTDLSMASWTTEESNAMDKCGHCDNCTHPVGTVFNKDVTLEAWQTLKIVQAVDTEGGRQTIAGLSDLARGAAGGSFEAGSKRRKGKEKVRLDYSAIAGGEVVLIKDVRDLCLFIPLFGHVLSNMSFTSFKHRFFASPSFLSGADDDGAVVWTFARISNCLSCIYFSHDTWGRRSRPPHTPSTCTSYQASLPFDSRGSLVRTYWLARVRGFIAPSDGRSGGSPPGRMRQRVGRRNRQRRPMVQLWSKLNRR